MSLKNFLIVILLSIQSLYGQTASTYFPAQTGYKWNFKSVPLDSLNNPVNSLEFYGIDSFAVVTPYFGKTANVVLSKTGTLSTINSIPFLDSTYYNFDGTNGFEYFDPTLISGLLGNIDTSLGINFVTFFNSLEDWYSYYRFASGNNVEYQIFKKDTAVTVNSISATLRFELIGKKLADETLNTEIGTFNCKKFLLEVRISYLLLNIFPVKMFGVENTIWLAPNNWKVKSYIPTTNVDLSYLGFPAFNIPGLETNITTPITSLEDNNFETVKDFVLYQNYPNPFNPSTKISWQSSVSSWQTLKVYGLLGNEVATLVDEYRSAGNYEVDFSAAPGFHPAITSGIYFYQLQVDGFIQSKKMILLK
ncbi:MAG: T9SS type A sorting domain-containing protein [Ignavibacteriaceae bacterium]|nr:T9SS type A sorting domain-containing protein [Ignavibacteriaceae bacterium]HMN25419.1 T9SS type A sorting domain-containing protein [Ignavibacteriaceae bacterium]HRN27545.1 T9SS type A sorting domain-containing protein [Ignavibacteriaceae bacterium]HRQ55265.1 T9SS type A sorting domain-containing protein [Ignavibacteriaceae bacterium]